MHTVTMDSRGRVTLGRRFCDELGIRPGDKLSLAVADGILRLARADSPDGRKLASLAAGSHPRQDCDMR